MFLSDFFFFCQSTATVLILRYCLMNTAVTAGFHFIESYSLINFIVTSPLARAASMTFLSARMWPSLVYAHVFDLFYSGKSNDLIITGATHFLVILIFVF